jgi:hypothetical protein
MRKNLLSEIRVNAPSPHSLRADERVVTNADIYVPKRDATSVPRVIMLFEEAWIAVPRKTACQKRERS